MNLASRDVDYRDTCCAWPTTPTQTAPALVPAAGLDRIQQGYNDRWSCPLTPAENRLQVAVRAGEKVFHAAGH